MRRTFAELLLKEMDSNQDIVVITADLGYGMFDSIRSKFSDRFFNTGAAEMQAMGFAVGLALEGKLPIVYSITPFLIFRAAEIIRNYINHECTKVILVGSGRNDDYKHDGFSHYAGDDEKMLSIFNNIRKWHPENKEALPDVFRICIEDKYPQYINLKR